MSEARAALDIGSNTIRLLVARREHDSLVPLLDDSEFVRLGLDVDKSGELRPDREAAALQAIERFSAEARERGADRVFAIATSAVRDARNGQAFVDQVRAETGVEVRIISGDEEAELTYLGATTGASLQGQAVVVDLGGGSAEIIAAEEAGPRWARSLPLGSGRLTEQFIRHDPPAESEITRVQDHVRSLLAGLPPARPAQAILTGGTATHTALLAGRQGPVVHLTPADLDGVLDILRRSTAADLVTRYAIRPERAAVLPAGVAALAAIVAFYHVTDIVVTRQGIREGVIEASLRHMAGF